MRQRLRIPAHIDLPFGFHIIVKQVSRAELDSYLGKNVAAAWVCEEKAIYLDKSRPVAKRRADLTHELIHAVTDWQAHIIGGPHGDAKH